MFLWHDMPFPKDAPANEASQSEKLDLAKYMNEWEKPHYIIWPIKRLTVMMFPTYL